MEELTKQDIFNQVYLGLKRQGFKKSLNENETGCMYRSYDGKRCAVGHLIKDGEYSTKMEGRSVGGLDANWLLPKRLKPFLVFLSELQRVHDESEKQNMRLRLVAFAEQNNLTIPEE